MFINMEDKIEFWKKNLLDLGKRNRLINFRATKRSTLSIKEPKMFNLWDSLVEAEKPVTFPFYSDVDYETPLKELIEKEKNPIITDKLTYGDLQKTLINLRAKSRAVIEEQGINTLYLAFGFLRWTETNQSTQNLLSPLLLVPVKLIHESLVSPFELHLSDDEIVVNPALKHKFQKDFGIELPNFDEDVEFQNFIDEVKSIADKKNWEIEESTNLGLFSFLKINMYNDLENNKDEISEHPIVRAICGDKDSVVPIPEDINQCFEELDKNIAPEDTFQVLDADSSQQKAILCANKGVSFILQGPPGTGKSQTITNIIAEGLANNKKILFVSEKIAALDVVHKRLTQSHLDDFCLVLHNHKANKKDVLEQLNTSLDLAGKKSRVVKEAQLELQKLYKDKEELNEYAKELHEVIKPLGKNIYEINGELSLLEDTTDVVFDIKDVRQTNEKQFNRYINLLEEFRNTLSEQALKPEINPWKNTILKNVTNELRRNINANLPLLVNELNNLLSAVDEFKKKSSLKKELCLNDIEIFMPLLKLLIERPQVYYSWFTRYDLDNLLSKVKIGEETSNKIKTSIEKVKELFSCIPETEKESFSLTAKDFYDDKDALSEQLNKIEQGIKNDTYLDAIRKSNGTEVISSQLQLYQTNTYKIKESIENILVTFEDDIFELDIKPILTRIKTDYNSFFRIFKKSYKEDLKKIKAYAKDLSFKLSHDFFVKTVSELNKINKERNNTLKDCKEICSIFGDKLNFEKSNFEFIENKIKTLQTLSSIQWSLKELRNPINSFKSEDDSLKSCFDSLYRGLDTPWDTIKNNLLWSKKTKEYYIKNYIDEEFLEFVCNCEDIAQYSNYVLEDIVNFKNKTNDKFNFYFSLFEETEVTECKQTSLRKLLDRISSSSKDLSFLEQWIDFNRVSHECSNEGLAEYISSVISMKLSKDEIVPCFKKRFYSLWLDSVINDYPAVRDFRRHVQDSKIKDFSKLDRKQLEIAKARIREKLINSLPVVDSMSSSLDEIGILKRELKKQRRRMPIRKLFRNIPNIIMSFKPCLMMSPLSVSLFLESNAYKFDMVIFDEASQVKTENAIGAIFRGKQVIIAGDSKQLPPTNFFNVTNSDNDFDTDEEDDESGNYESVIDEANLLTEETLKWHYRSRDEQLIAFSNAKIYKSQLVTFPSNKSQSVKDNGVEYYYLPNGVYDRGGSKGNVVEAEKVADLVFEHFKKYPSKSLGVITFGEKQQNVIEAAVIEKRKKHPELEEFFNEDVLEEPFFIKNLESVQGDERDTIILSIGYAKDSNGIFRMNFGPLNKIGGERRLNVAITRAKYNLKLVGSILPTDIDIDKISSEGPKLLRTYIDFAQNGVSVLDKSILESDITEFDSPFEEAVYNFLDRNGYKVVTQVGCSSYRIDMAIKHPTVSGVYILGIECDGATYHSSKTARDRDRLRQDVLENMGWTIYRIWSTDWIKDSKTEGKKLIAAIEDAIKNYSKDKPKKVKEEVVEKFNLEIEEDKVIDENNIYDFDAPDLTGENLIPSSCFLNVCSLSYCGSYIFYEKRQTLIPVYINLIKKCSPIHIDELCSQIIKASLLERLTPTLRNGVYNLLKDSLQENRIIYEDDYFVYITTNSYQTHYGNVRKIEHIKKEELANAMFCVLKKKVGLTIENLFIETAKAYNFSRVTKAKEVYFSDAFDLLIKDKRAEIIDGNKVKVVVEM